jgi:hypothetical protein
MTAPAETSGTRPGAWRSRWAAVGAAVAVVIGAGGLLTASATGSPPPTTYVGITPCRVVDTRSGSDNVGARSTPLGTGETYSTAFVGAVGKCNIPLNAVAVVLNLAIVNPTGNSFLTVFPGGQSLPLAANLNYTAGQAPVSNAATVQIGQDGKLSFYNLSGNVDISVDVSGYFLPAGSKTQTISYGPDAPNWIFGGSRLSVSGCITISSGTAIAHIPIDIPIGSQITSIGGALYDSSGSSSTYSLSLRRATTSGTGVTYSSSPLLELTGGSGSGTDFGIAAGSEVFTVTDTDSYYLEFSTVAATNAFCSASVTYTAP